MWLNNPQKLWEILFELVSCPSFSGTVHELDMARKIYAILAEMPYFQSNPAHLKLNAIENDKLGRCFATALLKGKGKNTVILLHHHDVVDVDDYGSLRKDAFNPPKITKELRKLTLPEKVRRDMESNEWIFGRGIMDMKAGAALQLALIHDFSAAGDFTGNILLLSVPGEESNSEGMLGAVPALNRLQEKFDLDYVAVVNSEPQDLNDEGGFNLATGSIGKVLPIFYCYGKETHARKPFEGFNSSLIFSQIEALMEDNIELCDQAFGEISAPPVNLRNKDLCLRYNVTTPQVTVGYYNVFSMRRTALEILELLKKTAYRAFNNAISIRNANEKKYALLTGKDAPQNSWQPNIYTYEELYSSAREAGGEEFQQYIDSFIKKLRSEEKDEREFTIKLIDEVHSFCPDRSPKVVIGFAPPYYPQIVNREKTKKERHLLKTIDKLKVYGKQKYGLDFFIEKMHQGITDLSYCGLQDSENIIKYLTPNMPAIGHVYHLPVEELKKLDLALINVGPFGRDAHKFTERLNKPYFENIAPYLLKYTVVELLKFQ